MSKVSALCLALFLLAFAGCASAGFPGNGLMLLTGVLGAATVGSLKEDAR